MNISQEANRCCNIMSFHASIFLCTIKVQFEGFMYFRHVFMYVCMYVCMVVTFSRVWINRVRLPIRKRMFPCPRTCLRIWSRETGSAVPSRINLLILHTQVESGAYLRDSSGFLRRHPFIHLNRHTLLGQCMYGRPTVYRLLNA